MSIKIYWAPIHIDQKAPTTLIKDLGTHKTGDSKSFFSCPSVNKRFKNTYVFKMPTEYDEKNVSKIRPASVTYGNTVIYKNSFLFFSDHPVIASFTAPYFHPPKHFKFGAVVPGAFDIGSWYRPYNCEFQLWKPSSFFHLEQNEPIFYMEVLTDLSVELVKYKLTENLIKYASPKSYGKGKNLKYRYDAFKEQDLGKLILEEIQKNLVDNG